MKAQQAESQQQQSYRWPVNLAAYDRSVALTPVEQAELEFLVPRDGTLGIKRTRRTLLLLKRLIHPLDDVLSLTGANPLIVYRLFRIIARQTNLLGRTLWGWTESEWVEILCPTQPQFVRRHRDFPNLRLHLLAVSYLLGDFAALHAIGKFKRPAFAARVFGDEVVNAGVKKISDELLRGLHQPPDCAPCATRAV